MPRLVIQTCEQSHKLGKDAEVITGTVTIDASQRRGAACCSVIGHAYAYVTCVFAYVPLLWFQLCGFCPYAFA